MAANRRKIIWAHKDMQLRIVMQILFMVVSGMLLTGGSIYMIIWQGITGQPFASGQISIIDIFDQVNKILFIVVPAIIIIMGWLAIIISHRIAGPLVRLNNGMKSLENGQWLEKPMKFRKGDEGHHLAEQFNLMSDKLKEMINSEQETIKIMLSDVESYSKKLKRQEKADKAIIEELESIQNKHKKMSVKGFTLIELMIVVLIIGILAAIAIPNYLTMRTRAMEASVKNNMHTLQIVLENFNILASGAYPANLNVKVSALNPASAAGSIAENTTTPPFPPEALICPHAGFANPFDRTAPAIIDLASNSPTGPSGIIYYTAFDSDGNIMSSGTVASAYKIRGHGKTGYVDAEIIQGEI